MTEHPIDAPRAAWMHAVVAKHLDLPEGQQPRPGDPRRSHHDTGKGWSLGPLIQDHEGEPPLLVCSVGLVDDALLGWFRRLVKGLASGDEWLGAAAASSIALGAEPVLDRDLDWFELGAVAQGEHDDVDGFVIKTRSPVGMRRRPGRAPKIGPGIFGPLRRLWREFCPLDAGALDLDIGACGVQVQAQGDIVEVTDLRQAGPEQVARDHAFDGTIEVDLTAVRGAYRSGLLALGLLAESAGVGAGTTRGYGSVDVVA